MTAAPMTEAEKAYYRYYVLGTAKEPPPPADHPVTLRNGVQTDVPAILQHIRNVFDSGDRSVR